MSIYRIAYERRPDVRARMNRHFHWKSNMFIGNFQGAPKKTLGVTEAINVSRPSMSQSDITLTFVSTSSKQSLRN